LASKPGGRRRAATASRPGLLLAGLTTLTTVTGVVGSLGAPLVPGIAEREGVSLASAQWSLTATLLVAAVATPVIGRLGVGRRRRPVLLWCLGLVAVGALLAALPLGFAALVAGRALQGLAFGISALAIAVARESLPAERVVAGLAGISVAQVVSAGLGFPVAALLADLLGVKGAFGAGFVLVVVALLVGVLTVPAGADGPTAAVDWPGAVLLTGGTLAMLLGVSGGSTWGYASVRFLVLCAVAVLLMGAAVPWLLRVAHPLVDLRLASRGGALAANLAGLVAGAGLYLMMSTVMILVQSGGDRGYGLGRSVTVSGLMLVPYAVASLVANRLWLRLDRHLGPDGLLTLGCVGFAVSNVLLAVWHSEVWHLVVAMLVGGIGGAAVFNAIPRLLVRAVPVHETGSAMAFNIVLRFLGFSLGSALSVAVLARLADAAGRPTEEGYVVVALVGLAASAAAAAGSHLAARRHAGRSTATSPREMRISKWRRARRQPDVVRRQWSS
jgi:predicted MFS family arabinose efflux permease